MTIDVKAPAEIKHYQEGNAIVSECMGFQHYNSGDAESIEDAKAGYADADENPAQTLEDFLASTFHLIQQTGGCLVYKGRKVCAFSLDQCGGMGFSTFGPESRLMYGGRLSSLQRILES